MVFHQIRNLVLVRAQCYCLFSVVFSGDFLRISFVFQIHRTEVLGGGGGGALFLRANLS
jgi:hypothetical protein